MAAINIPEAAARVISTLEQQGHEAFAVGGCVRDSLLGKEPHDWDICTSALPAQMKQCFAASRILETGIKHGTLTVMIGSEPYEVTTYRVDGEYADHRHPDGVRFVSSLKEDLSRRDFTINAMAYSPSAGMMDYHDGAGDLANGLIRCVGNPDQRFKEDALRMMRALRFASVFGFGIADSTSNAIHRCGGLLNSISAERVGSELCKLLVGKGAGDVLAKYVDDMAVIIPELTPMVGFAQDSPYHHLDVWGHTVQAVASAPECLAVRLAVLFHDIAKPVCYTRDGQGVGHFYGHPQRGAELAVGIMKHLKFDNETLCRVRDLVFYHHADLLPIDKHIRRWLNKFGEDALRQLVQVKYADVMGQPESVRAGRLPQLLEIGRCIDQVIGQRQCFNRKGLAVNGRDLMDIGFSEGAGIGWALHELLGLVLDGQIENDRETLLEIARQRVPQ